MFKTANSFTSPDESDTWKWIGRIVITIAAGIILSQFGVKLPDDLKI